MFRLHRTVSLLALLCVGSLDAADIKVTRYVQNCLLVEDAKGARILVDPGKYNYEDGKMKVDELKDIDVLILTHSHPDHFHEPAVQAIVADNPGVSVYATKEVAAKLETMSIRARALVEGDGGSWAGGTFTAVRADHVVMGASDVEAFGVLFTINGKTLYITSDTLFFHPRSLSFTKVDCVMLPISDRQVTMSEEEGVEFAAGLEAKLAVPVHYESPKDVGRVDPVKWLEKLKAKGLAGKTLGFKESLDL